MSAKWGTPEWEDERRNSFGGLSLKSKRTLSERDRAAIRAIAGLPDYTSAGVRENDNGAYLYETPLDFNTADPRYTWTPERWDAFLKANEPRARYLERAVYGNGDHSCLRVYFVIEEDTTAP